MREIKFRVWDLKSKKMNTESVCFQLSLGLNGTIKPAISENILMQFTGLTDKNGVEIYEGDVDNKGRVCEYFPLLGSFGFKKPNYSVITFLGQFITSGCEIVGNKFENPELL